MQLFEFTHQDCHFNVDLDLDLQLEKVFINGTQVSMRPLSDTINAHSFTWGEWEDARLEFGVEPSTQEVHYELIHKSQLLTQGKLGLPETFKSQFFAENDTPLQTQVPKQYNLLALGGVAFKLLKTVKVVKVGLAALTLAAYSVLFTFEFALALVGVLVFHELGHLQAMKKFGIPTKGMYLIPFVGGFALGDKPKTQWEDLYISMMGPVYGLLMSGVFYVIYEITDSHFCGLVASVSAFINLLNLLPVHPLDGGRVVKALVFSYRNKIAFIALLVVSALCLVFAWKAGLAFLSFFIVLGVLDLVSSWSVPLSHDLTPLKPYGIAFSVVWYLSVITALLVMIIVIAKSGLPGSELVMHILKS